MKKPPKDKIEKQRLLKPSAAVDIPEGVESSENNSSLLWVRKGV